MTVLAALTTSALAALLGRPASTTRVVTMVVAGQALLHAVLTAVGGHGGSADAHVAAGPSRVAVPGGTLADALGASSVADRVSAGPGPVQTWIHHLSDDLSSVASLRMAVAHVLAAAVLGLWLASGERLAWRLVVLLTGPARAVADRVAARILAGLTVVGAHDGATLVRPQRSVAQQPLPTLLLLARAVVRRGPPALSV
jgi:hypothetical protein